MPDKPFLPETADIETSSDGYATRFSGATGKWFLDVQERIVHAMLKDRNCRETSVLDVGGGHGQLAIPLCRDGYRVTVVASDESCRKRIAGIIDAGQCSFTEGNLIELPFKANSFDVTLCFRLLTHCTQWQKLVSELCRVSRQSVIVDYPAQRSFNAVIPLLFGAKKKIEKNTREWTNFKHSDILAEFAAHGFVPTQRKAQFFLPMALHRALKVRGLSAGMEAFCRITGLTALLGSPVIIHMRRRNETLDFRP